MIGNVLFQPCLKLLTSALACGEEALDDYMERNQPIPFDLRMWACHESSFMVELSTHSQELARMSLMTRPGNSICPYHTCHASKAYDNDIATDKRNPCYKVTGVPYMRTVVAKRSLLVRPEGDDDDDYVDPNDPTNKPTEEQQKQLDRRHAGEIMSCGCKFDDVLLDFFIWKSVNTKSPSTKAIDTWQDDLLEPRHRSFVTSALRIFGGLRIGDLYDIWAGGEVKDKVKAIRRQTIRLKNTFLGEAEKEQFKKYFNM